MSSVIGASTASILNNEQELRALQPMLVQLQTFLLVTALFIGAILWDFFQVIFEEAKYIFVPEMKQCWTNRKLPSFPTLSLLAIRLLTIPMMTLLLICLSQSSISTNSLSALSRAYVYMQATAGIFACAIFIIRTIAIREAGVLLKILLWTYLTGLLVYGFVVIFMAYIPDDLFSLNAYLRPGDQAKTESMARSWTIILSLLIALDLAVFLLCLETRFSKFKKLSSDNKVARTFYIDAFWYFGVITTVAVFELVWLNVHRKSSRLYMALIIPVHTWVNLTLSPHVIRRLKMHTAREVYKRGLIAGKSKDCITRSPDSWAKTPLTVVSPAFPSPPPSSQASRSKFASLPPSHATVDVVPPPSLFGHPSPPFVFMPTTRYGESSSFFPSDVSRA